jgi:predicted enzyme related to lactoylglutathione lyase
MEGRMIDYDNFFLPATDLEAAKEFYHLVLQFPLKFDLSDEGMIAFTVGSQEPALIMKDVHRFPDARPTIWFVVDSVKEEYERLKSRGVKFLSEPFAIATGWAVEFQDPFGNKLKITDYSIPNRHTDVNKSIASDLRAVDIYRIVDLEGKDPELLNERSNNYIGKIQDC